AKEQFGPTDRATFESLGAAVLLPVTRSDFLTAFVALGPKRSGDVYTVTDLALLAAVADKVSGELLHFEEAEIRRQAQVMQEELVSENQRLQALDKLRTELVSTVSHELRTPLTVIKGSADNMLDGLTGPLTDKQLRYLTHIKANSDRLTRFTTEILDLSRIEARKVELKPTTLPLLALTTEVADSLRPLAAE